MDKQRKPRGRTSAFTRRQELELRAPDLETGMLDGYARAIQEMGQHRRDEILRRAFPARRAN